MSAGAFRALTAICGLAILARTLTPDDFGIYALAAIVYNLTNRIRDVGLSQATIQRFKLSDQQATTLFYLTLFVSTFVAALSTLTAPILSHLLKEPRILPAILILAIAQITEGSALQHRSMLLRAERIRIVTVIESVAYAIAISTAIYLALNNFGFWSLVYLHFINACILTIAFLNASHWHPSTPDSLASISDSVNFGIRFFAANVTAFFHRNFDTLLYARASPSSDVGLYSKATQIAYTPLRILPSSMAKAILPRLSKLQNDIATYADEYTKFVRITAFLNFALSILLLANAATIVNLLLGDAWTETTLYIAVLGPAMLSGSAYFSANWIFASMGHANRLLRWNLIYLSIHCIVLSMAMYISRDHIPLMVSASLTLSLFPFMEYSARSCSVPCHAINAAVLPPLCAAATISYLSIQYPHVGSGEIHQTIVKSAGLLLGYILIDAAISRIIAPESRGSLSLLMQFRSKRSTSRHQ